MSGSAGKTLDELLFLIGMPCWLTRCQFHKHFTCVIYSRSEISWRILKTLHGTILVIEDGTAYFAKAVSYTHKMLMKFTPGNNFIKLVPLDKKARVFPVTNHSIQI